MMETEPASRLSSESFPHSREELSFPLLIPSFHQVPYTSLLHRMEQGSQSLFELHGLLNERKELEEKQIYYLSKVSRANLYSYEIETSSTERLLGFFKNYHLYLSKEYVKFHKEFQEEIVKVLEELKISRASLVNKDKTFIQTKLREVSQAEEALDRAKKHYQKCKKDLEKSVEKLAGYEKALQEARQKEEEKKKELANAPVKESAGKFNMARMFTSAFESTPEQDRDRQQKKVERRKDELRQAQSVIMEKKQMLLDLLSQLDEGFQKAATDFQETETDRMRRINSTLQAFCRQERSTLQFRLESLTLLEEAVTQQNITEDSALFIEQTKQSELTHKYASALRLIDEFHHRQEMADTSQKLDRWNSNSWVTDFEGNEDLRHDLRILELLPTGPSGNNTNRSSNNRKSMRGNSDAPRNRFSDSKEVKDDNEEKKEKARDMEKGDRENNKSDGEEKEEEEDEEKESSSVALIEEDPLSPALMELNKQLELLFRYSNQHYYRSTGNEEERKSDKATASPSEPLPQILQEHDWVNLLETKDCRDRFLQELDNQRCLTSEITETMFSSLRNAMKVVLDMSESNGEVRTAMRIKNMANTFHLSFPSETKAKEKEKVEVKTEESTASDSPSKTSSEVHRPVSNQKPASTKHYLHNDPSILHHSIWKLPGLWETALKEDIFQQLQHQTLTSPWDELTPEALKELVINIHNMLFGQLGSLSMTMLEQGLSKKEVVHQIKLLSQSFQLTEEQEFELITNITGQAIKSYTPPAIIPIVTKSSTTTTPSIGLTDPSSVVVAAGGGGVIPVILVPNTSPSNQTQTMKSMGPNQKDLDPSRTMTNDPLIPPSSHLPLPATEKTSSPDEGQSKSKDPNQVLKRFGRSLPGFLSKGSNAANEGGNPKTGSGPNSSNGAGSSATVSKSRTTSHEDDEFAVL